MTINWKTYIADLDIEYSEDRTVTERALSKIRKNIDKFIQDNVDPKIIEHLEKQYDYILKRNLALKLKQEAEEGSAEPYYIICFGER